MFSFDPSVADAAGPTLTSNELQLPMGAPSAGKMKLASSTGRSTLCQESVENCAVPGPDGGLALNVETRSLRRPRRKIGQFR